MTLIQCPEGHGPMEARRQKKPLVFKGEDLVVEVCEFVCGDCGFAAGTIESAGELQRAIAEAYREKTGLLTRTEIRRLREAKALTQQELADRIKVGIASIKRWESGVVQSRSMDQALRSHLQDDCALDAVSGNRPFSVARTKLVAKRFEQALGRRLLRKNDRMLFAAKYLWYGDMVAARELGRSMTGATYAALPYGPQLNNYKDLLENIMAADEHSAEPLRREEERIIDGIARKFPKNQMAYDAAHREKIWSRAQTGALIPYSRAHELTEI